MDEFMGELIGLLEDKKEEVRTEASTAVAGLTGSVDGKELLERTSDKLFPVLLRLLHDESAKVTAQVYAALVNLSLDENACRSLLSLGVVQRVMEILRGSSGDKVHDNLQLTAKLLSNLTLHQEAVDQLLQKGRGPLEGYFVSWVVTAIVSETAEGRGEREYFAGVLTNVSQDKVGRKALLDGANLKVLSEEVMLTKTQSDFRRESLCRVFRNVFMGCAKDGTVGQVIQSGSIEACIVLLASRMEGGDASSLGVALPPPGAAVEARGELTVPCREALLEGVLCLAEEEESRKVLWKAKVPEILQKLYEKESEQEINEILERCADIFISNQGDGEDEVGTVEEIQ
ncbi:DUF384 domain-containing protein [Chloropicon primus]|nr:DUF384 domain-containing protein [Chloropicon primus]